MKLSVYYIVKNEIRSLPESLLHTIQFADQIVIVDTGSTDGTWEFLQKYRLHEDFTVHQELFHNPAGYDASVSRNIALGICVGDWVLALDGDEFISADEGKKLKNLILENSQFDVLKQPVFNFMQHPKYVKQPYYLNGTAIRLFKNKDVIYKYNIHPELEGWKTFTTIDIPIYHYQFLEAESIEEKTRFRVAQMNKKMEKTGPSFKNYLHMADIFRRKAYWTGVKEDLLTSIYNLQKALDIENNNIAWNIYAQMVFQLNESAELKAAAAYIKSKKKQNKLMKNILVQINKKLEAGNGSQIGKN